MFGEKWTTDEVRMLRAALRQQRRLEQIEIPGRSRSAIQAKVYRIGARFPPAIGRWTLDEELDLCAQWKAGKRCAALQIAGRSRGSITAKRHQLGLIENTGLGWLESEDLTLSRGIHAGKLLKQIDIPGRSVSAKCSRAKFLGLSTKVHQNRMVEWCEYDLRLLLEQVETVKKRSDIVIPGKTRAQIEDKLCRLKLRVHRIKRGKFTEAEMQALAEQLCSGKSPQECELRRRSSSQIRRYFEQEGILGRNNCRWSKPELAMLRREARTADQLSDIVIPGRSPFGIRAKLMELGIFLVRRPWSTAEVDALKRQLEKGTPWQAIVLPLKKGEKPRSVATMKRFAAQQGLFSYAEVRGLPWSEEELQLLAKLREQKLSAKGMLEAGYFCGGLSASGAQLPARSLDSIAQQIRRLKLGDKKRAKKAREGRKRVAEVREALDAFLLSHGTTMLAEHIAEKFGVSRSTVKNRGKKLGVCLSWKEAIALPDSRFQLRQKAKRAGESSGVAMR